MFAKLVPYIVFAIYRSLQFTWRIKIVESEASKNLLSNDKGFTLAHWHGDEMGIFFLLRRYKVACMISTSKDGAIMNKMAELYGAKTVRGSSTRQGTQALKGILRLAKIGFRPSSAVDGPKGPIFKVKPGVFQISRLAQLPIVPLSFHASKSFVFQKSWNKAELPKPFSKVTVYLGEPLPTVTKLEDSRSPELAKRLESALHDTKARARSLGSSSEIEL